MLRKLFSVVSGSCCADNPDSPQHQEVLLPGTLYGMIIKERLEEALNGIRAQIMRDLRTPSAKVDFFDGKSPGSRFALACHVFLITLCADKYVNRAIAKVKFDIGAKMANFLATGNLVSPTGLDLQQASGFTIVAEKLNWQRYISHFRSIHRGAFFAELKTTTVRKLLPEAWGMPHVHLPLRLDLPKSMRRFLMSCAYPRRIPLRSPQSSIQDVSNRDCTARGFAPARATCRAWHDSRIHAICGRACSHQHLRAA